MSGSDSIPRKHCNKCRQLLTLDHFTIESKSPDGLAYYCRTCHKANRKPSLPPADYVLPRTKRCFRCKLEKPLADFSPNRHHWDGCQTYCRACDNERRREAKAKAETALAVKGWERRSKMKYRYGITLEEYERLAEAQGGVCAICGNPPEGGSRTRRLHVDHDHRTKSIRGLTCNGCNRALGQFGDTLEGVLRVVRYLERAAGGAPVVPDTLPLFDGRE